MATYKNGISGAFSGKVGTVVGSSWKGIDYMRSLPRRSKRIPSEPQKAQRMKMALAIRFLSPVSELVNIGFESEALKKSGFNVATSRFISEAIVGLYPEFVVDYSKVLISSGTLTGAWNASVSSISSGTLNVIWTNNSGSGTARETDKAVILVYNPAKAGYVYTMAGADRNTAIDSINLPPEFSDDRLEVWITFISANSKSIATSIYAGSIIV